MNRITMSLRQFSALLSLLVFSIGGTILAEDRPNFLVLIAADLCWRDLGYEGNTDIQTPHLDKLRTESMHLTRMFTPATTCSPSRHALYTGLFPVRSGADQQPYPMRAVRDNRYKLIRNLTPENTYSIGGIHKGEPVESWQKDAANDPQLAARVKHLFNRPGEELYDLQADEFELRNIANDPQYAEIKSRLQSELDEWMKQQGDQGLETENLATSRQGAGRNEESAEGDEPKQKKGKGKAKAAASEK